MTMDSATTCGHEVTHLSSEGEPTMEMTMGFGTYGHEEYILHLRVRQALTYQNSVCLLWEENKILRILLFLPGM
jgi:hypothetical protein